MTSIAHRIITEAVTNNSTFAPSLLLEHTQHHVHTYSDGNDPSVTLHESGVLRVNPWFAGLTTIVIILFFVTISIIGDVFNTTERTQDTADGGEEAKVAERLSLPEQVFELTNEKKRRYYNELFDTKGNQIVISSDQIIIKNSNKDQSKEGAEPRNTTIHLDIDDGSAESQENESDVEEDEDDASIYLNLDKAWNRWKTTSDDLIATVRGSNDTTAHRSKSSAIILLDATPTIEEKKTVSGNCIICFENFQAGDTIVYSAESRDCNHVYHKECMVDYLTNRKLFKEQLKSGDTDPSCPTCRQTFCKLIPIPIDFSNDDATSVSASC